MHSTELNTIKFTKYKPTINGNHDGTCHGQSRYFNDQYREIAKAPKTTRIEIKQQVFENATKNIGNDRKSTIFKPYYSQYVKDNIKSSTYTSYNPNTIVNELVSVLDKCINDKNKQSIETFLFESFGHSSSFILKDKGEGIHELIFFEPNTNNTQKIYFKNLDSIKNEISELIKNSNYFSTKKNGAICIKHEDTKKNTIPEHYYREDDNDLLYHSEALFMGVYNYEISTVQYFSQKKCDLNISCPDVNNETPLIRAIKTNQKDVINILLQNDHININQLDSSNMSALMYAMQNSDIELAKTLDNKNNMLIVSNAINLAMQNSDMELAIDLENIFNSFKNTMSLNSGSNNMLIISNAINLAMQNSDMKLARDIENIIKTIK